MRAPPTSSTVDRVRGWWVATAALIACAPVEDAILPPLPAAARAIALIAAGASTGRLLPLPLDDAPLLAGPEVRAQLYAELPAPLLDETPVEVARACDRASLPPPLESWALDGDAPRSVPEIPLRAPALHCAPPPRYAIAPADDLAACRRIQARTTTCGVEVDFSRCGGLTVSRWPRRLDGVPCGPSEDDALCRPSEADPGGALAVGACEDEIGRVPYALFPVRPAELDVTTIPLGDQLEALGVPRQQRTLTDVLASEERLVLVAGAPEVNDCNRHVSSAVVLYDRRTETATMTIHGPCVFGLVSAPDGGFWATFWPSPMEHTLGLGRFDAAGRMVQRATWPLPPALDDPGLPLLRVIEVLDTTPASTTAAPELAVLVSASGSEIRAHDRFAVIHVDATRLTPRSTFETLGSATAMVLDGRKLVVHDDRGNLAHFLDLPLTEPPSHRTGLFDPRGTVVDLKPLLAASDRSVWLAGRGSDRGGVDVYTHPDRAPILRLTMAQDPLAACDALQRVGEHHAIALFHHRVPTGEPPGPLWAAVIDFGDPARIVVGDRAQVVATETVHRARLGLDGALWAVLPRHVQVARIMAR